MIVHNPHRCGHFPILLGFVVFSGVLLWLLRTVRRDIVVGRTC